MSSSPLEVRAPLPNTELKEAIWEFQIALEERHAAGTERSATRCISASKAIEALFSRLLSENERQAAKLQAIEDVAESYVNTDDGDHANWVSIIGLMYEETQRCLNDERREISQLREAMLTPEEAQMAEGFLHGWHRYSVSTSVLAALSTKLRLRSLSLTETQT